MTDSVLNEGSVGLLLSVSQRLEGADSEDGRTHCTFYELDMDVTGQEAKRDAKMLRALAMDIRRAAERLRPSRVEDTPAPPHVCPNCYHTLDDCQCRCNCEPGDHISGCPNSPDRAPAPTERWPFFIDGDQYMWARPTITVPEIRWLIGASENVQVFEKVEGKPDVLLEVPLALDGRNGRTVRLSTQIRGSMAGDGSRTPAKQEAKTDG